MMSAEIENIEKERGSFMIMWREDVKMLRETISDEERRVIVEALFDWFLGQEMALTGLLGMVLTNLIEKQKRGVEFRNAKQEAGRIGGRKSAEKRWGYKQCVSSDKQCVSSCKQVVSKNNSAYENRKQVVSTVKAKITSNSNSNSNSNSVATDVATIGGADGAARVMAVPGENFVHSAEATIAHKRMPPSLEEVLIIAHNLGIDKNWARGFYADMTADNWCYINASGNTAIVNAINVGSVMRKRHKWATEKKSGGTNQPKGVNLADSDYDFSKFNEGN